VFVTLERTGHFVHIERPAEVAGLIVDFLASHP
jgi:pimeloyl-ACP methyl ester carboxylesterase